jgi:hypothetical protein
VEVIGFITTSLGFVLPTAIANVQQAGLQNLDQYFGDGGWTGDGSLPSCSCRHVCFLQQKINCVAGQTARGLTLAEVAQVKALANQALRCFTVFFDHLQWTLRKWRKIGFATNNVTDEGRRKLQKALSGVRIKQMSQGTSYFVPTSFLTKPASPPISPAIRPIVTMRFQSNPC